MPSEILPASDLHDFQESPFRCIVLGAQPVNCCTVLLKPAELSLRRLRVHRW